jgi:hypothetical protein
VPPPPLWALASFKCSSIASCLFRQYSSISSFVSEVLLRISTVLITRLIQAHNVKTLHYSIAKPDISFKASPCTTRWFISMYQRHRLLMSLSKSKPLLYLALRSRDAYPILPSKSPCRLSAPTATARSYKRINPLCEQTIPVTEPASS